MPRKRYSTEQIVTKLRQAEAELGRGLRGPTRRRDERVPQPHPHEIERCAHRAQPIIRRHDGFVNLSLVERNFPALPRAAIISQQAHVTTSHSANALLRSKRW